MSHSPLKNSLLTSSCIFDIFNIINKLQRRSNGMAKKGMELPFGSLQMLVAHPTPMAVETGDVYRVLEAKYSSQSGQTQAKLIGPVKMPQGADQALDRLLAWFEHMSQPITMEGEGSPYEWEDDRLRYIFCRTDDASAMLEDVAKIRAWRSAMRGERKVNEQTRDSA